MCDVRLVTRLLTVIQVHLNIRRAIMIFHMLFPSAKPCDKWDSPFSSISAQAMVTATQFFLVAKNLSEEIRGGSSLRCTVPVLLHFG